jgi:uncharacterized protein (TIGR02145 family)
VRAYATTGAGTAYGNDVSFTTPGNGGDTASDVEGNVYHTKAYGGRIWMLENLRVSKYNDGTPIPQVTGTQWSGLTSGAWCNYNNDPANDAIYGKLYNWFTVNTDKLAPVGWHVASSSEWIELAESLTPYNDAGYYLKSTDLWTPSTIAGSNSSGFTALPGGFRDANGNFGGLHGSAYWWCPAPIVIFNADFESLDFDNWLKTDALGEDPVKGFSIRCVKN